MNNMHDDMDYGCNEDYAEDVYDDEDEESEDDYENEEDESEYDELLED